MNGEMWKIALASTLSALVAGVGSVVAIGKNSATRDYVDDKVNRVEDRVERRLSSMETKVDQILLIMSEKK